MKEQYKKLLLKIQLIIILAFAFAHIVLMMMVAHVVKIVPIINLKINPCTGHDKTCSQKKIYIREEELEKQFDEAVKAVTLDDKHLEYITTGLKESLADKIKFSEERITSLQIQHKKIKDRLDKLYIDKLDGIVSNEFWIEKKQDWTNQLEAIENLLQSFHNADKKYYDAGVQILELLKNAYNKYLTKNNHEKRKMLKFLLSNCTINNKKVSYDYNLPFAYFVNFDNCHKKYPGCDSNA